MADEPDPWHGLGVDAAYDLMTVFILLSSDESRDRLVEEKGLMGVREVALEALRFVRASEPNQAQLFALSDLEKCLSDGEIDLDCVSRAIRTFLAAA